MSDLTFIFGEILYSTTIEITYIYGRIYVSLIQLIYIHRGSKNSQNYMLDNPDYKKKSIGNYKWEIFQTFMLALHVYVTSSLTLVYPKK